jgi:peptidoglycan L-alanyl-D-glutamate endopeptidase CwlK
VHPELQRRVKNLADGLSAEEITIQIDAALRTPAQQDAIYAEGRTSPGKEVTNARGCQSNHVIGCAVDVFVEDVETNEPDWNASHPAWQRIVALAPQYGLRDGISWHDLPHLELAEIPTEPTAAIQELCKTSGVQAVWDALNIPTFG